MKEFLSGLAMLILLSVFLVQFTTNQVTHNKLLFIEKDIQTSLQEIKKEGCLTNEIKNSLTDQIKADLNETTTTGITITASHTNTPATRGELITYSITVPIRKIIGANLFFGITNNETTKTFSGSVASEYIDFQASSLSGDEPGE